MFFSLFLPFDYLGVERILQENLAEYENQQRKDREGEKEQA